MMLYIDTREPLDVREAVKQIAKYENIETHEWALQSGDYETDFAVVERKTAEDLLASSKDKKKRLFKQLGQPLTSEKAFMLLITGTAHPVEAIAGIVASTIERYPDYKVLWVQDQVLGLWAMIKWFKKVEEGATGRPHNLKGEVMVSKFFGIQLTSARELIKNYTGLVSLLQAIEQQPNQLLQVFGIGEKKLTEMRTRSKKWRPWY